MMEASSLDYRETLLSCVWQGRRAKKKRKALFTELLSDCRIFRDWQSWRKICPNLPARSASSTSTNLLAYKHSQCACDRHPW